MNPNELNPTPPRRNDPSPWGAVDHVERLADGIHKVSTASHGGIWLSPERAADMPAWTRKIKAYAPKPQWWEEDCEAAIPLLVFNSEMHERYQDAKCVSILIRTISSTYGINLSEAA